LEGFRANCSVPGSRDRLLLFLVMFAWGCQAQKADIQTVDYVDLDRFAGDWYVIASLPTFLEKDAYAAIESYAPPQDGKIETTFSFHKGGFDGERKVYRPTAYVEDDVSNAVWGMQFVWPFKAEYRVVYLDENYQQTIIGRTKRDYVWIMARQPFISDADMARHLELLKAQGYDTESIKPVPQRSD
jgi:apolipoprotein D and lipocalin family protein